VQQCAIRTSESIDSARDKLYLLEVAHRSAAYSLAGGV
jgi:hypothetical protein